MRRELRRRLERLEVERGETPEMAIFCECDFASREATLEAAEQWHAAKPGRLEPMVVLMDGLEPEDRNRKPPRGTTQSCP